jgi:hypothetical protein
MSKGYMSRKDRKLLWAKSGNCCAFPGCRKKLAQKGSTGNKIIIGVEAHIKGEKPTASRYDHKISDKEGNSYENRILLCPTHHTLVDSDVKLYAVENLLEMKEKHEKWVSEKLQREEIGITFSELEVITKFLATVSTEKEEKITVVPLKDKIKKNELTPKIEDYIKIGLLKIKLVKEYIDKNPDINFGKRLKQGFVNKYLELKKSAKKGDELFLDLFEFASNRSQEFKTQAAGLAVLTYFFETCEVFEK